MFYQGGSRIQDPDQNETDPKHCRGFNPTWKRACLWKFPNGLGCAWFSWWGSIHSRIYINTFIISRSNLEIKISFISVVNYLSFKIFNPPNPPKKSSITSFFTEAYGRFSWFFPYPNPRFQRQIISFQFSSLNWIHYLYIPLFLNPLFLNSFIILN